MKKSAIIIAALAVASVFLAAGCNDKKNESESSYESSAAEESVSEEAISQPDPSVSETNEESEAASEQTTEAPTESTSEEAATEEVSLDENGAVVFEVADDTSDDELIAAAQKLYESACETNWNYHVGCPYELDYQQYIENDLGWQYNLVTTEGINSLADVEADYYKVFSSSYPNDLNELYIESNGRVYALDGERGANIYYTGSKVVSVTERGDSEITFSVENYYDGDDFEGDGNYTKTAEFSAVIEGDGTLRAGKFTLPF